MRIIAGAYGGLPLVAPAGDVTRPTTDRMRESLMSRIISERGDFEGARVLDAFSGSGALGLEALSRGARHCVFCERDRRALRALRSNIERLALDADRYEVRTGDVFKTVKRAGAVPFDLVFLDPPYDCDKTMLVGLVGALIESDCLARDALISYEYRRGDDAAPAWLDALGLSIVSTRSFAQTSVALARISPETSGS